jgi:hypothetical protein
MSSQPQTLEELAAQLDPQNLQELRDFAEFLVCRRNTRGAKPIGQSWAGALSHLKDQYSSIELQKKALEWRGD